jgi:hypothetical protein
MTSGNAHHRPALSAETDRLENRDREQTRPAVEKKTPAPMDEQAREISSGVDAPAQAQQQQQGRAFARPNHRAKKTAQ